MSRLVAYGWGFGVTLVVLSPALRDPRVDSYPLSTYPMFARERTKPLVFSVEGRRARGDALRLEPAVIANGEVMQAASRVRRAVKGGEASAAAFCAEVAERVARRPDYAEVREVAVTSARYDPVRYFERGPEPEDRAEHARCKVSR